MLQEINKQNMYPKEKGIIIFAPMWEISRDLGITPAGAPSLSLGRKGRGA